MAAAAGAGVVRAWLARPSANAAARRGRLYHAPIGHHHGDGVSALRHRTYGPDRRDRQQGDAALPRAQPARTHTVDQG